MSIVNITYNLEKDKKKLKKFIMEFDLTEEISEIHTMLDAWKWKSIIYNIYELNLKKIIKHGIGKDGKKLTEKQLKIYLEIEQLILNELDVYEFNINDIYK